jgi:hypothetical protein
MLKMHLFKAKMLITENKLATVEAAEAIFSKKHPDLTSREVGVLVQKFSDSDPYTDKRLIKSITHYYSDDMDNFEKNRKKIKEMHEEFKKLYSEYTDHPIVNGSERHSEFKSLKSELKRLVAEGEGNSDEYDSLFIKENNILERLRKITDESNYSDDGLEKSGRINDGSHIYVMYKVSKAEDLEVPVLKNVFSHCVFKGHFESYGGPPYYAVTKTKESSFPKPFAVLCPKYLFYGKSDNESQAYRNGQNDGKLSNAELDKIRKFIDIAFKKDMKISKELLIGIIKKSEKPSSSFNSIIEAFGEDEVLKVIKDDSYLVYEIGILTNKRMKIGEDSFIHGDEDEKQRITNAINYSLHVLEVPWVLAGRKDIEEYIMEKGSEKQISRYKYWHDPYYEKEE